MFVLEQEDNVFSDSQEVLTIYKLNENQLQNPPILNEKFTENLPIASEELNHPSPESFRIATRRIDIDYSAYKAENLSETNSYDNTFKELDYNYTEDTNDSYNNEFHEVIVLDNTDQSSAFPQIIDNMKAPVHISSGLLIC